MTQTDSPRPDPIECPVLVVGGGPAGLAMAIDLAQRNIPVTLLEKTAAREGPSKMMLVGVRTMEFCRWIGMADRVSNWGFPPDFCTDSQFIVGSLMQGWRIGRIEMPTMGGAGDSEFSPERQRHCPQHIFDPMMRERAASLPLITRHYKTRFQSMVQYEDHVLVDATDTATGEAVRFRAQYVVGADGFRSSVREQIGIQMRGHPHLDTSINVEFEAPGLLTMHPLGQAIRYAMIGPEGLWATLIAVNGNDRWRITLYGANDIDVDRIDIPAAMKRVVGQEFEYRMITIDKWARMLVIGDRFQDGRAFLVGDAAHTLPPNGGLGMNTGIDDVRNLGWKLAARLQGWGGAHLLDSYDIERRPVCQRAGAEALINYGRLVGNTVHDGIDETSERGEAMRAQLGNGLVQQNSKSWQPSGIHLGYTYDPSPIVVPDGTPRPEDDTIGYVPNARPGIRAPHFWTAPGVSVLDEFGVAFTLLNFGEASTRTIEDAAARAKVPLRVVKISSDEGRRLYQQTLVLVRPDGHVAWRGDAHDADATGLLARVTGAGYPTAAARAERV